jgi:hypothetical protein
LSIFTKRESNTSVVLFNIMIILGLIAFIWNTLQNQLPYKFLGFDFWDSFNYQWGYWVTRIYKFYLWVLLLPSLAHIQVGIMLTIRKLIIKANMQNEVILEPYHKDSNGGAKAFIDTIIHSIAPILFFVGMHNIIVINIHKQIDYTTVLGLLFASLIFLSFYLIPAFYLKEIIVSEKDKFLNEISHLQNSLLEIAFKNNSNIKVNIDAITSLTKISKKIKSIPNWPQFTYISKLLSLAISPTILNIIIKLIV